MTRRSVTSLVLVAALAAVGASVWLWTASEPAPESEHGRLAAAMAGDRWYSVRLRHRPVGQYRAVTERAGGDYRFRTMLEFALTDTVTRVEEELVFAAETPHPLRRATHERFSGDALKVGVRIGDGEASIREGDAERRIAAAFDFTLADYLAVERWLRAAPRRAGEVRASRSLDFDRIALRRNVWRVLARDAAGVVLEKGGMLDETRVHLDADFIPVTLTLPPLFTIERVADRATAAVWLDAGVGHAGALFRADAWMARVRPALEAPEHLDRLVLSAGDSLDWPGAATGDDGDTLLVGEAGASTLAGDTDLNAATEPTLTFPADAPALVAMADRATRGLKEPRHRADALTRYVHAYLSYREHDGLRTVHDTMRDRAGDCSEFADLLTTLARANGLPARTVVGIAYSREYRAFAPHAWNEIAIDRRWHAFDATWGQTRVDATHFAIPEAHFARMLAAFPDIELRVIEATYAASTSSRAPAPGAVLASLRHW